LLRLLAVPWLLWLLLHDDRPIAAGILFAVLVGGVFVLASVVLSTTGARGAPGASFWFGPRMVTGVALAAIWGVVGGAAGGVLFPSRPPPVSAGSTPSPPV